MTTLVTHPLLPYTIGKLAGLPSRAIACGVLLSVLPDADVIVQALVPDLPHALAHRGASHSIVFAMIMAYLLMGLAAPQLARFSRQWWRIWCYLAVCGASHGALDALTHFGDGVAFFWPLADTRYLFVFQPMQASPFLDDFFSAEGLRVLVAEAQWIWLPCIVLLAVNNFVRRARGENAVAVESSR